MGKAPARLMAGARIRRRSRADLARSAAPAALGRTIAVLGHERRGIAAEALDLAVEIPMIGTGASLNVAVAGSLVLYRLAGFI
jgi:tRNA (guanosine-2'-O-)-methyltransferase